MNSNKPSIIYLIDLPTFPKGILSLSFAAIAAVLPKKYVVKFIDLNLIGFDKEHIKNFKQGNCFFIGLKVSLQNYKHAIEITNRLKAYNEKLNIIWGGEYPSLFPNEAGIYANAVVCGAFENVANDIINDITHNTLQKMYDGKKKYNCSAIPAPNYSIIKKNKLYSQTMGFPMETSRGCDKKCTFCMVHAMQPINNFKTLSQLKNELKQLKGTFVNVVDYNIGSSKNHLSNIITAFEESEVLGWMGEMCLETLDNEELLQRLAKSRCRIIYCGLESISEESLISINKAKTNNIDNYTRIIKNAQRHGIQIAAGIIIGMEGATKKTIDETFQFYQKVGIIYAKITFLTYNPGTKVYESMKRVGKYLTEELQYFDGNHFTFLPHGVNKEEVMNAMITNIKQFYSKKNTLKRALNAELKGTALEEFLCFNTSYKDVYLKWLKYNIFEDEKGFTKLLEKKHKKSKTIYLTDVAISRIRKKRFQNAL